MEKRVLSKIVRPVLTEEQKDIPKLVPSMSFFITVDRKKVCRQDTLILNFFECEHMELKPVFRTFCQMKDYISQDLTTDRTKWKTGRIFSLTNMEYYSSKRENIVISSIEERNMILQFVDEFYARHHIQRVWNGMGKDNELNAVSCLDEYQQVIMEWRLQKRHKKIKAQIDSEMKKFGAMPKDYRRFERRKVFKEDNYIFYNRKQRRAYCTYCSKELDLNKDGYLCYKGRSINQERIAHNQLLKCPCCKNLFKCKSEGMGRKNLFAIRWSVLLQKHEDELLVRYFCHTKDFESGYYHPKISREELYREIYADNGSKYYMWGEFYSTNELRWTKYREKAFGFFCPSERFYPRRCIAYDSNISEAVNGTRFQYSAIDLFLKHVICNRRVWGDPWFVSRYLSLYRKKPYIEKLLKVGFYQLVSVLYDNGYDNPGKYFDDGKTLPQIMKIDRNKFKMLVEKGNPSLNDVKIMQYVENISYKEFLMISNSEYAENFKDLISMREYTTLHKVFNYLNKHKIGKNKIASYFDYIGWLKELGYNMKNGFNLFPKNFQKAHDEKYQEYEKFQKPKTEAEKMRMARIVREMANNKRNIPAFNMHRNGLLIKLPMSPEEMRFEGETLHHCVGGYVNNVVDGKTIILFIRKEEEPDKPYYTLEWKGRVIQCHGMCNCDMTEKVKKFVDQFSNEMINYEQKLAMAS